MYFGNEHTIVSYCETTNKITLLTLLLLNSWLSSLSCYLCLEKCLCTKAVAILMIPKAKPLPNAHDAINTFRLIDTVVFTSNVSPIVK